jgi:hypothetical protein
MDAQRYMLMSEAETYMRVWMAEVRSAMLKLPEELLLVNKLRADTEQHKN